MKWDWFLIFRKSLESKFYWQEFLLVDMPHSLQANVELEQYGRMLSVRIDGVPIVDNKTLDEVLDKVKSLIKEASCDIPDTVIDRDHRIGKDYNDKKQTFVVEVLLYILKLLGTEQCFIGAELI